MGLTRDPGPGETCEFYYCVLESRSFLEKMVVSEHTVPFFIPIQEAEADYLSSNAMKFIDYVGDCLQGYVDRREQVRLLKELYRNEIGELYHSLSYNLIEFVIDDLDWWVSVTVSLRYGDLVSVLPTRTKVLAWPVHGSKQVILSGGRRANGPGVTQLIPTHLAFAEEALRTLGLPEAYAEIMLSMKPALQQLFPSQGTVVS
ncbi:Centromere protein O [Nymphaea thermarum]|nr:Centromere protein O [Nymphaea thermarum]